MTVYKLDDQKLNQAVKRNKDRFPEDFMFQLLQEEAESLVSQFVIPHRKYFGGIVYSTISKIKISNWFYY